MKNGSDYLRLKAEISNKKNRLNQLKRDGFFSPNSFTGSQKWASLEARRRRQEIKDLENKLSEFEEKE